MDSNITINIVEPGGPTPVVPNTGLFTHGIGGPEATILGITAAVTILAVVVAILYYRNKKQGKFISLKHKKATTIGLASLAAVVSLGTVAGLLKLGANAIDAEVDEAEEAAEVTDGELTIELGDEPVFAYVKSTVTVTEDMPAGYTLKAYSENSTFSAEGTDKTISMVTIPEDGLENAGSLATALTGNTWGLSIEEPESQADEIYFSLPATTEEAVAIKSIDDYSPTEAGDETTVYYGVYITPGLPYGTYTGATVSYEVEPHYITNLSFDGNGSDGGTAIEGMTLVAGDTITLPQNTYTREGYSFTGWNTVATPTTEDPGVSYADEAEFTASLIQSEDITLYAQWEEDVLYMQNVSSWGSTLAEGDTIEAVDNRDGKTYWVARLKDGHIWMTQNLDLDLSAEVTLTPANTNITENWEPSTSTITIQGTSVPGWGNSNTAPYSADPGPLFIYSSGTYSYDGQYTSLEACQEAHSDCSMHNHAGNYYNWSAAVAMNDTSSLTTEYSNAPGSICPAGWRLPTSRDDTAASREWNALLYAEGVASSPTGTGYTTDGFNKIRKSPLWLARSGYVGYGSLSNAGDDGFYWSSTVYVSNNAYYLYFGNSSVSPADGSSRFNGYSIRCLAK